MSVPKRWRKLISSLKSNFPTHWNVSVRTKPKGKVKIEGHRCFGYCQWMPDGSALIAIEKHEDHAVMIDTLFHEYAHAFVGPPKNKHHPQLFWVMYGKICSFYNGD